MHGNQAFNVVVVDVVQQPSALLCSRCSMFILKVWSQLDYSEAYALFDVKQYSYACWRPPTVSRIQRVAIRAAPYGLIDITVVCVASLSSDAIGFYNYHIHHSNSWFGRIFH